VAGVTKLRIEWQDEKWFFEKKTRKIIVLYNTKILQLFMLFLSDHKSNCPMITSTEQRLTIQHACVKRKTRWSFLRDDN